MVSSALHMELGELLETLRRLKREFSTDPDYQNLRAALPPDWPM